MAELADQFSFSSGCVPQQVNKTGEAYTEKLIGHRGYRDPEVLVSLRECES